MLPPELGCAWLGRAWRHLPECGSTNDEAAAWARAGAPAGAVVTADAQTKGRGRLGRRWHSPPGDSLYFSVVLRPPLEPHRAPPLTLAAGVAVAEAVARAGVVPRLKWPNDVLAGGRKVAGILAEMSTAGARLSHLVLGIGVNLNTRTFPEELAPIATSLAEARGGAEVERGAFAAALCERLEVWHDRMVECGPAEVVRAWKGFAAFLGTEVTVTAGSERISGVAEDLDDDGALVLRVDGGRRVKVVAGELQAG